MSDSHLTDPLGRDIILHDDTWNGHIREGHPEVLAHRDLVELAVERPLSIRASLHDPKCRVYYGRGPRPTVMIQVVADITGGYVKTAHLAKRFNRGAEEWSSPTP